MGKKIFRSGEGKGIRGEGGTGVRKLKVKKKERKKKKTIGDRENGTVVAHIDLAHIDLEPFAQEPNALPVAYCDSGFNSGLLLCTLMRMLSVTYNTHTSRII